MSDTLDTIIIGGGVVGMAIARRLAMAGQDVAVLEAEPEVGTHTSSRNSEVIHAGIYYPQGSLKAELCVSGRRLLYEYCEKRRVPHRRIGKMIVASGADGELGLQTLLGKARANGVDDLQELDKKQVNAREPAVIASAGLLSPSTGIIDSHELLSSLLADFESAEGVVVCNSRVESIVATGDGFTVVIADDPDSGVRCRNLINAAGPWAPGIAAGIVGLEARHVPTAYFAKAHYFSYAGRSPMSMLVYPLPEEGGLGIHATLDMGGALRFGPDVQWVDGVSYDFDASRKDAFVAAIRSYFPGLDDSRLVPGYTGIRPKVSGPGEPAADFRIDGPEIHGIDGLVNLFGIESPGLTACLAIADHVAAKTG
jgi:L-2-hydroxyglutarate oxidase LhgO